MDRELGGCAAYSAVVCDVVTKLISGKQAASNHLSDIKKSFSYSARALLLKAILPCQLWAVGVLKDGDSPGYYPNMCE